MTDARHRKRQQIERLLPEIFRRTIHDAPDDPLNTLLDIMAGLQAPDDDILAALDTFFDPYRAPDRFVPFLAGWVDLDPVWIDDASQQRAGNIPEFPGGTGRLRELIASAAFLSMWRGTETGLLKFLEIATGVTGYQIDQNVLDDSGQPVPFHIRVMYPAAARPYLTLIERIVRIEKPAYVTYELAADTADTPPPEPDPETPD